MDHTILPRWATIFLVLGWTLAASAGQDRPSSNPASAPYGGATVSDWTGKVQVQPPGSSLVAPTHRQTLPPGTLLDTGDGRLLLRLEDESEILVRPIPVCSSSSPARAIGPISNCCWERSEPT